jgi:transglutaminase-like putative cysteine protease
MNVEEFLHDELLESLPSDYDRSALAQANAATYVIHQDVSYEYDKPVRDLRQQLVILPRKDHGDQRRIAHRFEVRSRGASAVRYRTDRFGNAVLHVVTPEVHRDIEFRGRAIITRTRQQAGCASWLDPRPSVTQLTTPDDAIYDAVAELRGSSEVAHVTESIADFIHQSFEYRHDVTSVRTTAAEAWQIRQGVCQDMAHVMIAMCSSVGLAARYVSGHLVGDGASHAWVEVFDHQRQSVVAIDPTHGRRTDLRYVTTAAGRDYRDVAPTAGTYVSDGGNGCLTVRKRIRLAELT